ncbi:hypothetical protein ABZ851_12795 [Streptomyces sp. NPDC047049]|uniref:effector-associated constant component EACC1 n=1 Tax=Streptomyces sp. NPDC047049 TaxID=3156688 RepID=UPI0034083C44
MRVDVRVDGGERELRSLYNWLRQDSAVRRGADVTLPQSPSEPDQMGLLTDVLQLVTDNGWSAASFALALSTWRQTRPGRRSVTVQRGETTVIVENGSEEELSRLIEALERPDDSAGGPADQEGR